MLVCIRIVEIFIPFTDRQQNLTRFVTKLLAFHSKAVVVINVHFGSLGFLRCLIVNEEVGSILSVGLGLLHPDGAHLAVVAEDLLDECLRWQLRVH